VNSDPAKAARKKSSSGCSSSTINSIGMAPPRAWYRTRSPAGKGAVGGGREEGDQGVEDGLHVRYARKSSP
jgi:hypothetical protein